jgi:hypothetical protein
MDAYLTSGDNQRQPDRYRFHAVLEAWTNVPMLRDPRRETKLLRKVRYRLIHLKEDVADRMEQETKPQQL